MKVASYIINIQNARTQIMLQYKIRKIGKENPIYKTNQKLYILGTNLLETEKISMVPYCI